MTLRGIGAALAVYRQPRLLAVLLMGFASGLPLALTGATLGIRLAESRVSLASIGFFSLATLSYNFKFLWAPLLDRVAIPVLTRRLGRRRSWALVLQAALMLCLVGLGLSDPADDLVATAAWAVAVAFCSATQDIVIDAYRVELLAEAEQGAGAAATQAGYRLGMIASGAGALYAAAAWGWPGAYLAMAALMLVGSGTVLLTPEPAAIRPRPGGMVETLIAPFLDFMRRPGWAAILVFVLLYNLGDAMAAHMSGTFYIRLGFTKPEIAGVTKLFGVIASLTGVSVGGIVVYRLGAMRALLLLGLAKMAANLMYLAQLAAGHDTAMLALTVGTDNFVIGMASSAFVAYLSDLCSAAFTATQYALLSALATLARTVLASPSGEIAQHYGWAALFLLSIALALPGLAVLLWLMRRPPPIPAPAPP